MDEQIPSSNSNVTMNVMLAVVAAIVVLAVVFLLVPAFVKPRGVPSHSHCINNLRMIDSGKEQAALVNKWTHDIDCDIRTNKLIVNTYIKGNTTPLCPSGGSYKYMAVSNPPTCNYQGATAHRLP
ncbi:MAG: hypothetical protein C0404_06935 [Verrucomicrobia bacterium]|nr:hypothetical protein [Verrucomicrobiota bacterium]